MRGRGEFLGSQVQLQTEELWPRCLEGRQAETSRSLGRWWARRSVSLTSAPPPPPAPRRPLSTYWPRPCTSLRPTSCLRPSGPGSTSFAKPGSPRPWQEVPSRPSRASPLLIPTVAARGLSVLCDASPPLPHPGGCKDGGPYHSPISRGWGSLPPIHINTLERKEICLSQSWSLSPQLCRPSLSPPYPHTL